MSNQYITNSDIYQVNAERDISVILSKFNTNYIYDCIDNALNSKYNMQYIMPNPNLIRSIEGSFNIMKKQFPDDIKNIEECREETYLEIINYLCSKFKLEFSNNDEVDLYSVAYYLYDLLAGNYFNLLTKFYSKYILQEKENLYKAFNLERFKKTANINYGKKIFKDGITSTILINISTVIDQLQTFDFDFPTIINYMYDNTNISNFILSNFTDMEYFYNFLKTDISNPYIRPIIITNIRLNIQNNSISDDILNNFVKEGDK